MSKTKKKVIVASALIVVSLILTAIIVMNIFPKPMFRGDYPYYPDVKSITDAADVIIVGEIVEAKNVQYIMVDETLNKTDKEKTPYTLSKIKIIEVLKGNVNVGDVITIKQLGDYKSKPEETLYKMNGYLSKNTMQLMFLCQYDSSPYSSVNPEQGIIQIKDDQTLYSANEYSLFGYNDGLSKKVDTLNSAIESIKNCINN